MNNPKDIKKNNVLSAVIVKSLVYAHKSVHSALLKLLINDYPKSIY